MNTTELNINKVTEQPQETQTQMQSQAETPKIAENDQFNKTEITTLLQFLSYLIDKGGKQVALVIAFFIGITLFCNINKIDFNNPPPITIQIGKTNSEDH